LKLSDSDVQFLKACGVSPPTESPIEDGASNEDGVYEIGDDAESLSHPEADE
jgi:hypothetical protein